MANTVNKDQITCEYEKQRASFIEDLRRFNIQRGTPFPRLPEINGQEVDLYHLYQRVTSNGGWQKVNTDQFWDELQFEFGIPKACTNSTEALKHIYFRYLNIYEKVNFLGEVVDTRKNEDEDGPTRKKICLPIESIPLSYNYGQHNLTDAQRQQFNLEHNVLKKCEYEKLELALHSGLPNEVDMAINVCVLLSTEGKHTMKLQKTNRILPLMLAHVGIFDQDKCSLEQLYREIWIPNSKNDFLRFWYESVKKKEARSLITVQGQPYRQKELVGEEVLHLGRDLGVLDSEGQRVTQLAIFIRNLSFEEHNQKILGADSVVFKFLILSLYSTYGCLKQLALDTLANLSCEMQLPPEETDSSQLILEVIISSLVSQDRFFLVRGLEMLSKICLPANNRLVLSTQLKDDVYSRLISLLTVQDIQIIVHSLEALYKLSKVGEPFTTKIARVHKAIDILVSFITIEAQSFGPGSLVGIKVVEYVPPANSADERDSMRRPTTVIQPVNPDSVNIYQVPTANGLKEGGSGANSAAKVVKEPVTDIHATTSNWLNATYEAKKKSKVNQVDLFSEYLQSCRKFGIKNTLSSADFLQMVKTIFQCEVLSINRKNGDSDVFFEGLCKRSTQKPFAVTTIQAERGETVTSSTTTTSTTTPSKMVGDPPPLPPPLTASMTTTAMTPASRFAAAQKTGTKNPPSVVVLKRGLDRGNIHGRITTVTSSAIPRQLPFIQQKPSAQMNQKTNSEMQPLTGYQHTIAQNRMDTSSPSNSSSPQLYSVQPASIATDSNSGDPMSVKSLLAKKLCQGAADQVPEQPQKAPTVTLFPANHSSHTSNNQASRPHIPQAKPIPSPMSVDNSSRVSSVASHMTSLSSSASSSAEQISESNIQSQSSNCISSNSHSQPSAPTPSSFVQTSQNSTQPVVPDQGVPSHNPNLNSNTPTTLAGPMRQVPNPVISGPHDNTNAQMMTFSAAQQNTNTVSTSGAPSIVQHQQNTQTQIVNQQIMHSNLRLPVGQQNTISVVPQQQTVNVQVVQQGNANSSNRSMVCQNTNMPVVQHQQNVSIIPQAPGRPMIQQTNLNAPGSVITMATHQTASQNNQSVAIAQRQAGLIQPINANQGTVGAFHQQSSSSAPSSITINHLIRAPSNLQVANHQAGSTPGSSNMVTIAAAPQCTTVTQSISSPAVAALLASNSQQGGAQMVISAPILNQMASGTVVQQQQTAQGQAPTTVVIQTPPGTIVMPSRRQIVVQGSGNQTFGSIQQGGQGNTVSFVVPQQYRHPSSMTVQGLNIIQQQGSVNVVPSLALTNNNLQSQQNVIRVSQAQHQVIQGAQNQTVVDNNVNQMGPRQIVFAPNQTTIPVGMQLASVPGNFTTNNGSICIASQAPQQQQQQQQPQQQQNFVIQSSSFSQPHSLPSQPVISTNSQMSMHNSTNFSTDSPMTESHQPLTSNQPQQQQQQQQTSNLVVQTSARDTQIPQTVQMMQCNGTSHEVNGVLGSPDSLSSDLPPSPLSSGFVSDKDIPNGKLSDIEKDTVLKKNDLSKLVEKTTKVNGFVHGMENGGHVVHQGEANLSTNPSSSTAPVSRQGQVVNGYSLNNSQVCVNRAPGPQVPMGNVNIHPSHINNGTPQQGPQQNHSGMVQHRPLQGGVPPRQIMGQIQQVRQSVPLPQQMVRALRPQTRISTLPCTVASSSVPSAFPGAKANSSIRPISSRGGSHDRDSSNDSVSSSVSDDRTVKSTVQAAGQGTQTPGQGIPSTPTSMTKRTTIVKKVLDPSPLTDRNNLRLRKKRGANEMVKGSPAGQGQQTLVMEYMCEWGSCRRTFGTARLVFLHVFRTHVPPNPESCCQWVNCEKLVRKRWSLVSHIQDYHCSEMSMRNACQRRYSVSQQQKGGPSVPIPPPPPLPMVYPPDAAIQAIRRFAIKPPYTEFAEQREGPVSKHIRLTAALILRNICHRSPLGRKLILQHEQQISYNTMNAVEASTALSQCLWDILNYDDRKSKPS